MLLSYCTTCHGRLWQLKQTLDENLTYTCISEIELCVLVYNDSETLAYLEGNYQSFILDKRLVVEHRIDEVPFTCGRVKNFSHAMGKGKILFNLDADNFIDTAHEKLLSLKDNEILHHQGGVDIGLSGRIGVYRERFEYVGGYRDVGRSDDGDLISRLLWTSTSRMKLIPHTTNRVSIDNER